MRIQDRPYSREQHVKKRQLTYGKNTRRVIFGQRLPLAESDSDDDQIQSRSEARISGRVTKTTPTDFAQGIGSCESLLLFSIFILRTC